MKKNYITPEINVIQLEVLCSGGFGQGTVFKGSTKGECIGNFGVVNEKDTKKDTEYKDLWGESNSGNWGND